MQKGSYRQFCDYPLSRPFNQLKCLAATSEGSTHGVLSCAIFPVASANNTGSAPSTLSSNERRSLWIGQDLFHQEPLHYQPFLFHFPVCRGSAKSMKYADNVCGRDHLLARTRQCNSVFRGEVMAADMGILPFIGQQEPDVHCTAESKRQHLPAALQDFAA